MGTVGGYSLDMYCDHPECRAIVRGDSLDGQVQAYDRAQAFRRARKAGWKINLKKEPAKPNIGTGTVICPKHTRGDV